MKLGKQIVIVNQGFVYLGECLWDGDFLRIEAAKSLRVWGTTHGLGQLINGPTKDTKADDCGTCLIPKGQVIGFLQVFGGW